MSNINNIFVVSLIFVLLSCSALHKRLGGDFAGDPEQMYENIGPFTKKLIEDAFQDIDSEMLTDFHVHIIGLGEGNTGIYVNPKMQSLWHPIKYLKFMVYKSASGINDLGPADSQYIERLISLIENTPNHGLYMVLAFDKFYHPDGSEDLEQTEFYVPNEYVYRISKENPTLFVPIISVHPYRKDALMELERWAKRGVRFVKWLPNAMGINPADDKIAPFYRKLKELDMILLTHTGEEQAVEAEQLQRYGNPLLYRKALDMGVKVIMAHGASLGSNPDLDTSSNENVSNFDLFIRMMEEEKYVGLLFGEISALTQFNRFDGPLQTLLEKKHLHHRLINGSDYPLPAVNFIIRTRELMAAGFITEEERESLNQIYQYNPLLFDFVLKRTLRHPTLKVKFPAAMFMNPFARF